MAPALPVLTTGPRSAVGLLNQPLRLHPPEHQRSVITTPQRFRINISCSRRLSVPQSTMITHDTLYSLANSLGALAMCTIVVYHFIAVNAKYVTRSSTAA